MRALDGIDLVVNRGECVGVLGESGSGKSTLVRALLGVTEGKVEGGRRLADIDLATLDDEGWRRVRWTRIAASFQSTTALNPVLPVGKQVAEPLEVHLGMGGVEANRRAAELLDVVGLGEWAALRRPHQLSGGQRRLVLMAIAIACGPDVLILDEPTSGLDPGTRRHVLELVTSIREQRDCAVVMLTHDSDALAMVAERVAVMYRGRLAEIGPARAVLDDPRHPYTRALLNARATLGSIKDIRGIRGDPPNPVEPAPGCAFVGRCTQAIEGCDAAPPPLVPAQGEHGPRRVSCIRGGTVTLLSARNVAKTYLVPSRGVARREEVRAVDGVSLEVREGEVIGVVGASGAGKSTLGFLLARLVEPDEGQVLFEGRDLLTAGRVELKAARRRLQILFQDPFEAISPRLTVAEAVREPLDVQRIGTSGERLALVSATLAATRVPTDETFLCRHAHELSGGQLQRVALARALVLEPKLLIADEPASMLDPSEQAKLLQLLKHLQVERGMAMLMISHDLATVLRVADRVLVLDSGRVVEEGPSTQMLFSARHPVTQHLLSAAGRDTLFPTQRFDEAMLESARLTSAPLNPCPPGSRVEAGKRSADDLWQRRRFPAR